MRRYCYSLLVCLCCICTAPLHAEERTQFQIDATQHIVYCDVSSSFNQQQLTQILNKGIPVQYSWHLHIERVRTYWMNETMADIYFTRKVTPDLLTHEWLLDDALTQIQTRTHSLTQALDFLTRLHHFPLLDTTLLPLHNTYHIQAFISVQFSHNIPWWQNLWNSEQAIGSSTLNLP